VEGNGPFFICQSRYPLPTLPLVVPISVTKNVVEDRFSGMTVTAPFEEVISRLST
jgi:hypothetical protein